MWKMSESGDDFVFCQEHYPRRSVTFTREGAIIQDSETDVPRGTWPELPAWNSLGPDSLNI